MRSSGVWDKPIVVAIEPFRHFYPAEEYHQDFAEKNPTHPVHPPLGRARRSPRSAKSTRALPRDLPGRGCYCRRPASPLYRRAWADTRITITRAQARSEARTCSPPPASSGPACAPTCSRRSPRTTGRLGLRHRRRTSARRAGKRVAANSVYRILDLFVRTNLANRVESANAYLANTHPGCRHDCIFLICDDCGQATHLDDDS
jgi:hypothetical protein